MNSYNLFKIRLLNFLRIHKWRLVLGLILVVVVYIALSFTLVKITVEGGDQGLIIESLSETSESKRLRQGLNLVKRGSLEIHAKTNTKATVAYVNARPLKINDAAITLKDQQSVDMYLYDSRSRECAFGNTVVYECVDGRLYRTEQQTLKKIPVLPELLLIGNTYDYKNGIISLAVVSPETDPNPVMRPVFTNGTSITELNISRSAFLDPEMFNVVSSSNGDGFLLNNTQSKTVYIFTDARSTPKVYEYGKDLEEGSANIVISLSNTKMLLNYQLEDESHEETRENTNEHHHDYASKALIYDISSNQVSKPSNTIISDVTNSQSTSDETRLISDSLVGTTDIDGKFWILDITQDFETVLELVGVDEFTPIHNDLFYRRGNDVYKLMLNNRQAQLLRNTKDKSLSALQRKGDSITFTATSKNEPSISNVYVVKDRSISGTEPFDILPYSLSTLPIINSRFNGNVIYIAVDLSSLRRDDNLNPVYSETEYTQKKNQILTQLRSDGLSASAYTVEFSPGVIAVENIIPFSDDFTGDGVPPEEQHQHSD